MENRETGDTRETEEKKETKAKKKKGYFAFNVGQLLCLLVSSTQKWPRLDRCAFKKGVGQSFGQKCRIRMSSMHANEPT